MHARGQSYKNWYEVWNKQQQQRGIASVISSLVIGTINLAIILVLRGKSFYKVTIRQGVVKTGYNACHTYTQWISFSVEDEYHDNKANNSTQKKNSLKEKQTRYEARSYNIFPFEILRAWQNYPSRFMVSHVKVPAILAGFA